MPVLVQGVVLMLISGVEYWDHIDVEWPVIQASSYFPFCPVRRSLYIIHGLRRGLCADRLGW